MDAENIGKEFLELLKSFAEETGQSLADAGDDLRVYTQERIKHLSTIVGDPGFDMARQAELDSIMIKAGLKAVEEGDKMDARILGFIDGALNLAARLLMLA